MIRVNVHEAKTQLSRYLRRLERGATIVLCRRNVPIAEIRGLPRLPKRKRPIGLGKGQLAIGPEFFEPLPDDLLDSFEGK
jgi:antitoxin (DNA-binding transcriptional repressor) of toxin-antitoxin stability system